MARKAELSLTGRQRDQDGEESVTESRMTADYYEKEGSSYILYEETQKDSGDIVRSIIKYNGSTLEMTRRGAVRSRMIFREAPPMAPCPWKSPPGRLRSPGKKTEQ